MRAGEVAQRAGVSLSTLRYYERRGLLPEPVRGPGGHRRYSEDAVRFVRAVKEAQAVGFTLAEIEEYLRVVRGGRVPAPAALRVQMAAKIDEIDGRIARLRRMRDELARVVGCACSSLDHCTCGAAYLARRGRDAAVRPSLLHVTNGDSAGNTLRQTSLGGAVLPWQDVLHEGPVPAGARADLRRARAAFLSGCGWGDRQAVLSALERRDQQLVQALREGCQVVLWFEHDMYDQLQLIDALALAAGAGGAAGVGGAGGADGAGGPGTLELIVVGEFPGRPSFRGLGELTADELETLWPARVPAGPAALAAATRAWAALRRPDPVELAACARAEVSELPFLAPALRRLLAELPAPADGLSGSERYALQAIDAGAATPVAAFLAAQDLEEAPFLGDAWFFRALAGLGHGQNRLVETQDGEELSVPPPLGDGPSFAGQPLRLTPAGHRVLARQADRVALLGIDRWLGGTRLTPAAAWRWDPATGQLTPPA